MSVKAGVHEKGTLSISNLLKNTRRKPDFHKVGAIAMFIGVVRGETRGGETVKELELEAYKEKADEVLRNICRELQAREGIVDVQIHHFAGKFQVGEELVYVLVAGSHRSQVFPVLEEAVERYKKEAPIFKKETITDEKGVVKSYWVSERRTE
jgi:molybdopterin synthase catalytic subunit